MPTYTFNCNNCGDFTLFLKTMEGNRESIECPDCGLASKRVFLPPNLYTLPRSLSKRIEKGMEPRRMTREELGLKQPKKSSIANRPWQA